MARIRSVKPEFWNDRKLARLSRDARLLYLALWNLSDEHGRLHGDARYIKGHCLPYEDDLDLEEVERLIDELADHGRVQKYEHDGDPYLFLPKLAKHQRLEGDKQASRLPAPPDPTADKSAPTSGESADLSAESPDSSGEIVAKQVAGGREQVAGISATADRPRATARDRDLAFEAFWLVYPRKIGKGQARKAWIAAAKQADPDTIMAGAMRLAQQPGRDEKFTPHPSTWLNGERWLDETASAGHAGNPHTAWAREQG